MYEGKAPELSATRSARMPAFFEHSNVNLPNTLSLLETSGLQAKAMVSKLNEIFPPTNPTPDDTMEKIMYRSGQRSVVEWVIEYMEQHLEWVDMAA